MERSPSPQPGAKAAAAGEPSLGSERVFKRGNFLVAPFLKVQS
jgi:hypothetical protein